MRIGIWVGRALAVLAALVLWALVWPDLRADCDGLRAMGVAVDLAACEAHARSGAWAGGVYLAVIAIPVVLVFMGHGRRRWLWPVGWTWLLLMLALTLTR